MRMAGCILSFFSITLSAQLASPLVHYEDEYNISDLVKQLIITSDQRIFLVTQSGGFYYVKDNGLQQFEMLTPTQSQLEVVDVVMGGGILCFNKVKKEAFLLNENLNVFTRTEFAGKLSVSAIISDGQGAYWAWDPESMTLHRAGISGGSLSESKSIRSLVPFTSKPIQLYPAEYGPVLVQEGMGVVECNKNGIPERLIIQDEGNYLGNYGPYHFWYQNQVLIKVHRESLHREYIQVPELEGKPAVLRNNILCVARGKKLYRYSIHP